MAAKDVQEGDLQRIWVNLLTHLSRRYREWARKDPSSIDYKIEELRNDHYGAFTNANHFRMCIKELARRHPNEIQVEGEPIRVTAQGILNYHQIDPTLQLDFRLPI